jgi:hypothetical protein
LPYEKRDNSGLIADNERKEKDTHPDMSGSVTVNGKDMWISGWWKDGRNGRFLSLAFREKDVQRSAGATRQSYRNPPDRGVAPVQRQSSFGDDIDDDIPF